MMYKERIMQKITESKERLELIRTHLPEDIEHFLFMSSLERDGIYKNVEFIIQNIIDICAILVKELSLGVPKDDSDILKKLKENKVLKKEIIDKIIEMKGFRNYLVHRYGELNEEIAFNDIKEGMDDFDQIFEAVESFLSKKKSID